MAQAAEKPPDSISVSEFVRRLIAVKFHYDLPSARERKAAKIRIDGNRKRPSTTRGGQASQGPASQDPANEPLPGDGLAGLAPEDL